MKLRKLIAAILAMTVTASLAIPAGAAVTNSQALAGQSWTEGDGKYYENVYDVLAASDVTNVYTVEIDINATAVALSGAVSVAGDVYFNDNWGSKTDSTGDLYDASYPGCLNGYFGPSSWEFAYSEPYSVSNCYGLDDITLEFSRDDGTPIFQDTNNWGGTYVAVGAYNDSTFSVEAIRYYNADGTLLNIAEPNYSITVGETLDKDTNQVWTLDLSDVPASETITKIGLNFTGISADGDGAFNGGGAMQYEVNGDFENMISETWAGLDGTSSTIVVAVPSSIVNARLYSDIIQCCYYWGSSQTVTLASVDIYTSDTGSELKGDVDGSGVVDVIDLAKLAKHVAGLVILSSSQAAKSDLNADSVVNIVDVLILSRVVTGLYTFEEGSFTYDGTALDFVSGLGFGWNLGNSFDSYNEGSSIANETGWGNPIVTKALIQAVKGFGFDTIRFPVTWMEHMSADGTIESGWMSRVNAVVDYCIDEGLYVILNTHWDACETDEGWINDYGTDSSVLTKFGKVWTQIANNFSDYDEHLIFEGMNEVGFKSVYNSQGAAAAYKLLNDLNTKFVDTVRATGGNNAKRFLLISGYYTDIDETCSSLSSITLPEDQRIMMSVHYYNPYQFCIEGTQTTWSADNTATLQNKLKLMNTNFVSKGIPVIIGEYGFGKSVQASAACTFVDTMLDTAESYGMCAIIWDNGEVINRNTYAMSVSGLAAVFAGH